MVKCTSENFKGYINQKFVAQLFLAKTANGKKLLIKI